MSRTRDLKTAASGIGDQQRDSLSVRTPAMVWVIACLLGGSLVLLLNPYTGIRHDSVLYLGQALALLYPDAFQHDIFFAYGNQASYTIVPHLLASAIDQFGIEPTFLWSTLCGLALFALSSWVLIRKLMPRDLRFPGLLALILMPSYYGAWTVFSYSEPFLTGRTLADPLVLAGLAMLVAGRRWFALAAWMLATMLHPIQALPVFVVGWCWLVQNDRRWLQLLWGVPAGLLACVLIPSLGFLTTRLDPLWYSQVLLRNSVTLYFTTGSGNWYNLLADGFIVVVAAQFATGTTRRYLVALFGAAILLASTQLILVDGLRLVWPAGLQVWRVHWLLHWSAMAVLPWVCLTLFRRDAHSDWPRFAIFIAALLFGLMPASAHPLTLGALLLYVVWPWLSHHLGDTTLKSIAILMACFAASHLAEQLHLSIWIPELIRQASSSNERLSVVMPMAALLLAVSGTFFWSRANTIVLRLSVPLSVLILWYSASHWDHRPSLQHATAKQTVEDRPFGIAFKPDDQILWLGNVLPAWSLLHRPSYMDQQQMAGLVFNRRTAIEGLRRKNLLHVKDGKGNDCRIVVYRDEPYTPCRPDDTAIQQACARTHGELAYFVLPYRLKAKARGSWPTGTTASATHYLYACRDFSALAVATTTTPIQ